MNGLKDIADRWGQLRKQQRILIGIATPLVFLILFYFLLLGGLETKHQEALDTLKSERSKQADLEVEIRNRHMLEQEFKFKQAKVRQIERKIPVQADPGGLLSKVYEQAGAARLDLQVFRPESELRVKQVAFIINQGEFSGTYHGVGEFLDRLTQLERLIKVLAFKITLSPPSENAAGETITRQLTGKATFAAFRLLADDELDSMNKKGKRKGKRK